jgi:hypothetical protein
MHVTNPLSVVLRQLITFQSGHQFTLGNPSEGNEISLDRDFVGSVFYTGQVSFDDVLASRFDPHTGTISPYANGYLEFVGESIREMVGNDVLANAADWQIIGATVGASALIAIGLVYATPATISGALF